MARSFVLPLWFWFALISGALVALYIVLSFITRFRNPATIEICHYLRGANIKRMFIQIVLDDIRGVPAAEFMDNRRLMMHEARKFMLAVIHDMGVLIAWCEGAIHRELVEKPWENEEEEIERPDTGDLGLKHNRGFGAAHHGPMLVEDMDEEPIADIDSTRFVEGHRRLAAVAKEFRRFAVWNLVRINLALLLGTHWRLRWLSPVFQRRNWSIDLLKVYGKVFKEVIEVGALYDDDLPEALLISLFKLKDPAADIALWRFADIVPH